MDSLKLAILKTLTYSDLFDYPLTLEEMTHFLIEAKASVTEVRQALPHLPQVSQLDGYYFLKGRQAIVGERLKKQALTQRKLEHARKQTLFLRYIPWLKLVAVTGGVAAGNPKEDDDIDLLVITSPQRLWLGRLGEFLILAASGQRRRAQQSTHLKDKLCPNFYLSTKDLTLPYHDLFTANELARVKVLWERGPVFMQLKATNAWVGKVLPNWYDEGTPRFSAKHVVARHHLSLDWLDPIERVSRWAQLKYMQGKKPPGEIRESLLMFHPPKFREQILKRFAQRVDEVLGIDKSSAIKHRRS